MSLSEKARKQMTKEQIDFLQKAVSFGEENGLSFMVIPNMEDHEFTNEEIIEYLATRKGESND